MLLTKKIKSIIIVSFILTILLLVGCGDDKAVTPNPEVDLRVIGTIHGIVTDFNTNARIGAIQVTTVDNGKILSDTTDGLGYYSFVDLASGEYEITFYGSGAYAIGKTTVDIPSLQDIIGTPEYPDEDFQKDFHYSVTRDMKLYGLNARLTGLVYSIIDEETTSLASGVTLIADFADYDISPDEYTVSTNDDGTFSFTGLPSTPPVFLRSMPYNDGTYDFSVQIATVSLIPNGTAYAGNIFLQIAPDEPFVVQNNFDNDNFGLADDLSLTFSKAMDANSFDIELSGPYGEVEFEETWSNDITLTIDPYVILQANETYFLLLSGFLRTIIITQRSTILKHRKV